MNQSEIVILAMVRWACVFAAVLAFFYMGDPDLHDLLLAKLKS